MTFHQKRKQFGKWTIQTTKVFHVNQKNTKMLLIQKNYQNPNILIIMAQRRQTGKLLRSMLKMKNRIMYQEIQHGCIMDLQRLKFTSTSTGYRARSLLPYSIRIFLFCNCFTIFLISGCVIIISTLTQRDYKASTMKSTTL